MAEKKAPMLAGTMQTDPRNGHIKRSSGVNVLPTVAETWAEVRDNNNSSVDWMICSFLNGSKTDVTVISKGSGGVSACAAALPSGEPCYGGFKLKSGRFQHFYYVSDDTSVMKKGRGSMSKNGVLNVMVGCDGEFPMKPECHDMDI